MATGAPNREDTCRGYVLPAPVLLVPPLTAIGSPVEIAGCFGEPEALRGAIADLPEELHSA